MKTPEEIMEAFKCCERDVLDPCSGCPYEREYAEDWKCALNNDALACIKQLERREWEQFERLSSTWHGKQYYFKQDDGTVYSRQSCKYITFEQAVEEFEEMLVSTNETAEEGGAE